MGKIEIIVRESEKSFLMEQTRKRTLTERADKFIGAAAVIVGFQLTQISNLALSGNRRQILHGWFSIGALVALAFSVLLTMLSMRVQEYHSYPRGTKLIDELKDESITEDVAEIKIARMYLSAHDINAQINDERARLLSVGGILLVVGLGLAAVSYLITKFA
jgi:hypothetical protein